MKNLSGTACRLILVSLFGLLLPLACTRSSRNTTSADGPPSDEELRSSAESGDIAAVKAQLKKGAHVNARRENDGVTALMLATQEGHVQIVEVLLDNGADANLSAGGTTPLMSASLWGYKTIAKMLIEKGANIEARDKQDKSALYYASLAGNDDIVKMLLEHGAMPTQKTGRSQFFVRGEVAKIDAANNQLVIRRTAGSPIGNENAPEMTLDMAGATYHGVSGLKGLKINDVVNIRFALKITGFNYSSFTGSSSYSIELAVISE